MKHALILKNEGDADIIGELLRWCEDAARRNNTVDLNPDHIAALADAALLPLSDEWGDETLALTRTTKFRLLTEIARQKECVVELESELEGWRP